MVEGCQASARARCCGRSTAQDLQPLSTTGVETEIGLPFAGLAELVAPLLGHVGRAAGGAAGACAPRGDRRAGRGGAGARAGRARRAAGGGRATRPLLLLVDDVQWLDASTQEAVAFLARRALRLPLALLVVRSLRGEPHEPWPEVAERGWRLEDLPRPEALALARAGGVATAVAEALVDAVGGNPARWWTPGRQPPMAAPTHVERQRAKIAPKRRFVHQLDGTLHHGRVDTTTAENVGSKVP